MFKLLSILLITFNIIFSNAYSEVINNIIVNGNDRIASKTIITFSEAKIGANVSENNLNDFLKNLYNTSFFEDVKISFNENTLEILVKEFPIIQEIIINGIKANKTKKELKEEVNLKEKNPFNEELIQKDLDKISNIFKRSGFYFVNVDVSVEENSNGTVNLIYDIDRGEKATIKEINFIGNKIYKDRKLRSIVTSEENKFWKFITSDKYINFDRIELDKRLLKNFYLNKGYYNVVINDAYSQLLNNTDFILTFNIDAGNRYKFGKFNLNLPDDFDIDRFKDVQKVFDEISDQYYSNYRIEKILEEIDDIALLENYEFIDAEVNESVNDNLTIDFDFNILQTEQTFVERINVYGNNVTAEEYIRSNLIVDEGDPFNKLLHAKSINNLKSTGIFQSVKSEINKGTDKDKTVLDIFIEERPTGEIMAGAGYGTDGSTFSIGIKENNFNGKGISISTKLELKEDSIRGSFDYTQPNFAYSNRSLTTSVQSTVTDKLKKSGYKSSLNAISLGTSYEQLEDLYFSPSFSISDESLETNSTASSAYKKQEGSYFDMSVDYGLRYDKRNQRFQPTSGFISNWYQSIPLTTDQASIINGYSLTNYYEVVDDMVISTGIYTRAINSVSDDDVRVSKRLFAPKSRLRGFESGKVGPKDGNDFVGGNYVATFNASSTIPYVLQTMENVDLKVFFDAGNIWGVDYSNSVDDSNKIRSSSGIALEVLTPIGPLSFSLAEAITKADTDKTETFRFSIGTTF